MDYYKDQGNYLDMVDLGCIKHVFFFPPFRASCSIRLHWSN